MYEYISHRLALIFRLKPVQLTSPIHCNAHSVGKAPISVRFTTLLGSSTAHVQLPSGIVRTGMNDFDDCRPGDITQ